MKKIISLILVFVLFSSCSGKTKSIESDLIKSDDSALLSNENIEIEHLNENVEEKTFSDIINNDKTDTNIDNKEIKQKTNDSSSKNNKEETSSKEIKSSTNTSKTDLKTDTDNKNTISNSNEVRAFWISYLEYANILTGKTKSEFSNNIKKVFSNLYNDGYNTVFVHVRSHGDSYYKSSIFPWSKYVTGTEGRDPGYDPLEIMVNEAHNYGLKIEAWINPYRIYGSSNVNNISKNSPVYNWIGTEKIKAVGNAIYLNPADEDVIDLIVNGVKEVVENYSVDGIHFDDYFYPTTDSSFDRGYYSDYCQSYGEISLASWRRNNVNKLIKKVYSTIKSVNPNCKFGISPSGNIDKNYNELYCDVYTWTSNSGYIDYLCPQIYFGFNNSTQPFDVVLKKYNDMIKVNSIDLYVGLAAYKIGAEDTYAGNGKNEWIQNDDIISREITMSRNESKYKGFAIYRYDSIFNPDSSVKEQVKKEKAKIDLIL